MKKNRINLITLGCSKNTVDSERLLTQLKFNNFEISDDPNKSDTIIINTCGFIEAAKKESIDTIINAVEMKNRGQVRKVMVVGCLSERYKKDLEKEIPEVDNYFGVEKYEEIIENLGGHLKYELLGERNLTAPSHSTYLKISEGCDNPCSFCAIPIMRGKHKSRPMDDLINEAKSLSAKGTRELVIIGQDTTDYGIDLYGKRNLSELLNKLSLIGGIEWIRLMYAYPSHFPDDLIDEIANNPKVVKYIDIPLQHISDKVLKSMRRGITRRRTIELLTTLRERIPGLVLRTTFIVGYPAETGNEFRELGAFISDFKFQRVGVFSYSLEEDTTAFPLGDKFSEKIKEKRMNELMEIQQSVSAAFNQSLVGTDTKVIVDRIEGDNYICRSYRDAPEVDGEIIINITEGSLNIGDFYDVTIYEADEYDLFAKLKK
ncbi:MAG: 30S ribosomal protein S12 methylthiotransferase RimO [Ignavibacteriaceae bacterium]